MNIKYLLPIFCLICMPVYSWASPTDTLTVRVLGTTEAPRFEPTVVHVESGDVIRFRVLDGLHTVTAYHPDNRRPLRIPSEAQSFDSGPLKAGEEWLLTIEAKGVYDYFCMPHERMGHVGRILVGSIEKIPDYQTGQIANFILEKLKSETIGLLKAKINN